MKKPEKKSGKKLKNNQKAQKIKIKTLSRPKIKEIKRDIEEIKQKREDSPLEEHVEESEIIEDAEFHEFLPTPESLKPVPVLEKIQEKGSTLEEDVASAPLGASAKEEGNAMSYSDSNYFESKYSSSGKGYETSSAVSAVSSGGRTRVSEEIVHQDLLNWQDENSVRKHSSFTEAPERMHVRNVEEKNELPFEKRDRKYQELKG